MIKKIILGLIILSAIVTVTVTAFIIWQTSKNTSNNSVAISNPTSDVLNVRASSTSNELVVGTNPTSSVSIAHTNEELCKSGDFTNLLDQEITFNKEIAENKFVQYLRTTLNNWIAGKYGTINEPKFSDKCQYAGLLRGMQCPDSVFNSRNFDIPETPEEYFKSKFIVLETSRAPLGGESFFLIFKDKPDKVFYAWVYRYYETDPVDPNDIHGFDFRGFLEQNLTESDIEEIQKKAINQLCNQEVGI